MAKNLKLAARRECGLVEVKSKFDAEFRRFAVNRETSARFEEFYSLLEKVHHLQNIPFVIGYTDADGDLLPINNDDNYLKSLSTARPILRLIIQRKGHPLLQNSWWKGQAYDQLNGYGTTGRKKTAISKFIGNETKSRMPIPISFPEDFRRVSAIIDVDAIPETHRRVKLMKNGSDKPLGFYIRDGTSVRVMPHGLEKVPGIFISRLVPGGLAESTGLLAVNDEVLEVNGIEVAGKTLDQVTDMMVANSSNLIITVKPVNQRNNISPKRGTLSRVSQKSVGSHASAHSGQSFDSDDVKEYVREEDDEDDVRDHLNDDQKDSSSKDSSAASQPSESSKPEEKSDATTDKDSAVVTL